MQMMQKISALFENAKALASRFRRADTGVAAVEFALTFPIYISTIMFLVEVSRIVYTQGVILHAAEEATRYALVHYDATIQDIEEEARDALLGLNAANLTAILVTAPVDPDDQTKLVTVVVRYRYKPILPFDRLLSDDGLEGISLTGESKGFITEEIPSS